MGCCTNRDREEDNDPGTALFRWKSLNQTDLDHLKLEIDQFEKEEKLPTHVLLKRYTPGEYTLDPKYKSASALEAAVKVHGAESRYLDSARAKVDFLDGGVVQSDLYRVLLYFVKRYWSGFVPLVGPALILLVELTIVNRCHKYRQKTWKRKFPDKAKLEKEPSYLSYVLLSALIRLIPLVGAVYVATFRSPRRIPRGTAKWAQDYVWIEEPQPQVEREHIRLYGRKESRACCCCCAPPHGIRIYELAPPPYTESVLPRYDAGGVNAKTVALPAKKRRKNSTSSVARSGSKSRGRAGSTAASAAPSVSSKPGRTPQPKSLPNNVTANPMSLPISGPALVQKASENNFQGRPETMRTLIQIASQIPGVDPVAVKQLDELASKLAVESAQPVDMKTLASRVGECLKDETVKAAALAFLKDGNRNTLIKTITKAAIGRKPETTILPTDDADGDSDSCVDNQSSTEPRASRRSRSQSSVGTVDSASTAASSAPPSRASSVARRAKSVAKAISDDPQTLQSLVDMTDNSKRAAATSNLSKSLQSKMSAQLSNMGYASDDTADVDVNLARESADKRLENKQNKQNRTADDVTRKPRSQPRAASEEPYKPQRSKSQSKKIRMVDLAAAATMDALSDRTDKNAVMAKGVAKAIQKSVGS